MSPLPPCHPWTENSFWKIQSALLQFSHLIRCAVSSPPLAVGDIAIEPIGRLSHTAQEVAHIVGCNTASEVLRHPERHLIIREIITKKLLEVVDVLSVPNRSPWHLRKLVVPLRSRNRCREPVDFLCERQ